MNELRTMHLFAGIGGGLLADLILGHRPVVAVEWEAYACQVLRERAAEGWFPGLHVWEGDVRLFDPSEYAGKVDCIHAGFPCQDISVAGKQAGVSDGTRSGLYREVLRIAGIVRPKYLFLENVAAILSNGLGTVLGDLAAMGYDTRWCCIRASDVGAPHHRDRWFAMAYTASEQRDGINNNTRKFLERESISELGNRIWNENVSNTLCNRFQRPKREIGAREERKSSRQTSKLREDVSDSERQRLQGQSEYVHAEHSEEERNWEAVESRNGCASDFWRTEPGLGRVAHGVPNRVGQLKGYGNAQVPLQAAVAWKLLGGE